MSPAAQSFLGHLGAVSLLAMTAPVIVRLPVRMAPVSRLTFTAIMMHLGTTWAMQSWLPDATYVHGAALFWFGFNCVLYVFSALYKSISLRILTDLGNAPDQCLTISQLVSRRVTPSFSARVKLLVETGLAQEVRGDAFAPLQKGLKYARCIAMIRTAFRVDRGGLYLGRELVSTTCRSSAAPAVLSCSDRDAAPVAASGE